MLSVIEFDLAGVPESWANSGVWSRRAAIAQSEKMKEWTRITRDWGLVKRLAAHWPAAETGHQQRLVSIYQYRHGELDDDNLFTSVKPIVDGLKAKLRRRGQSVFGAGLIWNDNPKHCHTLVEQEVVSLLLPTHTVIRVERFDL